MNNERNFLRFRQKNLINDFSDEFERETGEVMRSHEQLSNEQMRQIQDLNNYFRIREDIDIHLKQLEDNMSFLREKSVI